jgi:hypothetical protein
MLRFDRDIEFAGLVGGLIIVDDLQFNLKAYKGTGPAARIDAQTVQIGLVYLSDSTNLGIVRLSAYPGNGIVATSDGAEWPGVLRLELPFP